MAAFAGLIRGKLAAVLLGTAGVGIFGQIDTFYRSLVQICVLSTGVGVTRCIAELKAKGDDAGVRRAFRTILIFSLTLAALVVGGVLLLSTSLSSLVFGDPRYAFFLSVAALGLPLQALSDIMLGMLVGLRDLRAQLWVTASYTGGGVVLFALLILSFGLRGAIYGILAMAVCMCAASIVFLRKGRSGSLFPQAGEKRFDVTLLRFILAIGLTGGIMAISDRVVLLACRSALIRQFGFEANGLYQSVYSFSQLSISITFGLVSTYLMPTLSGLQNSERARFEFSSTFRLTLLISTIFSVLMVLYGRFVIQAAYSAAFLPAVPLLRIQALGDFARTLAFVLSTTIFALHGWKPWFVIGMSFYIGYPILFFLLLPIVGFPAICIAYLLAQCIAGALAMLVFARYTKMSFLGEQGPLLLRCVGLLALASGLAWVGNVYVAYFVGAAALLLWAGLAFTSLEYRRLWVFVSSQAALSGNNVG